MKPLYQSIFEQARRIAVPPNRIAQLVHGKRAKAADTTVWLELFLRLSAHI